MKKGFKVILVMIQSVLVFTIFNKWNILIITDTVNSDKNIGNISTT